MELTIEKLMEDISSRCPDTNFTGLEVVYENYEDRGRVYKFVVDDKHDFNQIYYYKNSYEENLQNTMTIIEQKGDWTEDYGKPKRKQGRKAKSKD